MSEKLKIMQYRLDDVEAANEDVLQASLSNSNDSNCLPATLSKDEAVSSARKHCKNFLQKLNHLNRLH